jgi:uncharacterized protein (TIGR03083 family)
MEVGDHYRGQREELCALALGLSADQLATPVPGCPRWQVQDVLRHLVGITADACSGTMEGAGSPPWTQAQVDARKGQPVADVVQEWTERGPGFEAALAGMGFLGWVFTYDVTLHGDDVREALGLPLGTSATHALVLDGIVERARLRAKDAGTLVLRAGDRSWTLGAGEPTATLTAPDEGELARVVGGRRSDEQVRALAWTGDLEPWLDVLPLFREGRS